MAANAIEEINSFVWKFGNLWASGYNATLVFEAHAGEACVHPCVWDLDIMHIE